MFPPLKRLALLPPSFAHNPSPPPPFPTQSEDEVRKVVTIMQNPRQYKIPDWFLNRQKDIKDGKYTQVLANDLNIKLRGMLL